MDFCLIRYKNNAMKLSKMFHDQPMKPLDKAVYWIEYIIRHNGAHHLKTAGNKLNWIQFMSIDVILVILIFLLIIPIIPFYFVNKMYKSCIKRKLSKKSNRNTTNDKKRK